jgi:MFS family permease
MATTHAPSTSTGSIRSLIPARLDRLTWSKFHTRLVIALGVAWVLDGLEITIAAAVGSELTKPSALGMSSGAVGDIASWYLIGEVIGAIGFGYLSDRLGRRNLFTVTLGVYLVGSALTATAWSGSAGGSAWLYLTRIIAGAGIGGEYAAINSAIDELIPAHYRGRVDIAVNGTYWAGSILGTLGSLVLLNHLPDNWGWRIAFLIGPILAVVIIFVRKHLPESPRWLVMHGREEEAERQMDNIERWSGETGHLEPLDESKAIEVRPAPPVQPDLAREAALQAVPVPVGAGRVTDDHPVVPLQRDFLHLHAGAHEDLRGQHEVGALVSARVRGRQPHRTAHHRPAFRHHRPQEDDRGHVYLVRRPTRDQR